MDIHSCRLEKYVMKDDGAATCLVLDREIDEGRLRILVKTLGDPAASYVLNGNKVMFRLENRNRKVIALFQSSILPGMRFLRGFVRAKPCSQIGWEGSLG